jgi:Arylsulfotransferase (ASST)/Secretion system C-terminal sorting domain/Bacterial Ig-like domain
MLEYFLLQCHAANSKRNDVSTKPKIVFTGHILKSRRCNLCILLAASLLTIYFLTASAKGDSAASIRYHSPMNGARYITPQTNVIIRLSAPIEVSTIHSPLLFEVIGAESGRHEGDVILSDDQKTLIFKPHAPFLAAETVTATLNRGLRLKTGETIAPTTFQFTIATEMMPVSSEAGFLAELREAALCKSNAIPEKSLGGQALNKARADSLPLDFPRVQSTIFDTTSPGRIFLSNFPFNPNITNVSYLMILDNFGAPVFYRRMQKNCTDFKLQPNGLLTYFDQAVGYFLAMDDTYAVVDSFRCGNGYSTDMHELQILDNGHALMLSSDDQKVDMSAIVAGGNREATVAGLIVQELDREKNVVFQWRSWDHFQITDATHTDFTAATVDYVHGNALELDQDGNLLLSCRHMDEITKISRETGEILWRLGGKNNQFTFVNDSLGFSHQHALRRLPNGHLTLFDNGNFHNPPFSRAVEYELDEQQKTATLVWQYRNTPDIYGEAMGYVQRLDDGNTLIGWGATNPTVTEVSPSGKKVFELAFDDGIFSYRAFRFPWKDEILPVAAATPAVFSLAQNYPNPFNASTTIQVSLPQESTVTFKVYDLLGREVLNVLEGEKRNAGEFIVRLNASSLPSGMYFYKLTTENFSQTKKMVVVK